MQFLLVIAILRRLRWHRHRKFETTFEIVMSGLLRMNSLVSSTLTSTGSSLIASSILGSNSKKGGLDPTVYQTKRDTNRFVDDRLERCSDTIRIWYSHRRPRTIPDHLNFVGRFVVAGWNRRKWDGRRTTPSSNNFVIPGPARQILDRTKPLTNTILNRTD